MVYHDHTLSSALCQGAIGVIILSHSGFWRSQVVVDPMPRCCKGHYTESLVSDSRRLYSTLCQGAIRVLILSHSGFCHSQAVMVLILGHLKCSCSGLLYMQIVMVPISGYQMLHYAMWRSGIWFLYAVLISVPKCYKVHYTGSWSDTDRRRLLWFLCLDIIRFIMSR